MEIWDSQWEVFNQLVSQQKIKPSDIAAIGITNQRETTVVWDKNSGEPVFNAIVWQDRRTASICESLKKKGLEDYIRQNTGLVIDAYFSGTKIKWILDNIKGVRQRAQRGELIFGTVDTWLIWKLTNGKVHATDYSNASRTLLYNIRQLKWDSDLLEALDVPDKMLPEVRDSSGNFGELQYKGEKIPITGVAGDQQAALFGQTCFEEGMAKNTYGTGCFLLMNTGKEFVLSQSGLITTIAWGIDGHIQYALEGSIFVAGAAIQWLRDGLKIIDSAPASEALARQAERCRRCLRCPCFCGSGSSSLGHVRQGCYFGSDQGYG